MQDKDTNQELSADDLALVDDIDDGGEAPTKTDDPQPKDKSETPSGEEARTTETDDKSGQDDETKSGKQIATGADAEEEDKAKEKAEEKEHQPKPTELTDEIRKMIAEHASAGDKKAYNKELRRLERVRDIPALWGMYRELESKFTEGGLVKIPGENASDEEKEAWRKARGIPEKADEYFNQLKLSDGVVIGEADKPVVDYFAEAAHKAGVAPDEFSGLIEAYYARQEEMAAQQDEADEEFRREAERELKDEFGPAFKRQTNAIPSLFATAPGGTDIENESGLYARLMGGRTADGKIIGNDPDMVRWLTGMASEVNPAATVTDDGDQTGQSIEAELEKIQALRSTDKRKYYSDEVQAREAELIEARDKIRANKAR